MAKKMISALKEIVGEDVDLEERKGRIESALRNENRFAIFQFLCRVPGSSIATMSLHFHLSVSAVKWHLEKLKNEGYVLEVDAGNRLAFFPKGYLDPRFVDVLCVLNEELPAAIIWTLLKRPGLTQKGLCSELGTGAPPARYALKKLERLRLVLSVIDGRFRRYYPTDELRKLDNKNRKTLRRFRTNLIGRFHAELLNPRIELSKSRESMIEIDTGSIKNQLYIPSDISASVISYYAEKSEGGKKGQ
ncbi:MAG: winged helix-turn-helix transcriptional regulator [Thermoplasmata archaeon]|nr:winged helix-turn-helix transcriptional regulator [Thermoplasmata archaeon]